MKKSRKRSWLSYFTKIFAVFLAVTAAIGGTALYGKYQNRSDNAAMDCHSRLNALENWFSNPKNADPSYEDIRRELALSSTTGDEIDSAFIVYDRKTDTVYDSTELIWSSVRFHPNNTKQIEKLKAAAPALAEQSKLDDGRYVINNIIEDPEQIKELTPLPTQKYEYSFRLHDVFIQDGKAYPGKITIYSGKKTFMDKFFRMDVLKELNYLEDLEHDQPSGKDCLHFTSETTVAIPEDTIRADMLIYMPIGTNPDSPALQEVYRYMKHNHGDYSVSDVGEYAFANVPKTATVTAMDSSFLPAGKTDDARFEIYYIAFYDFWKEYMPRLLFFSGIIFLIELLIAALIAKIMHMKYCKAFEMNEYRRNLTASLAHDLKSPLAVISGYAQNLQENVHTEKREKYADAILENAQYMDRIIADVLDLAKLEQMSSAEKTTVDLVQIANVTAERFAEPIAEKEITLTCSGKCTASCNEATMTQAIGNLIDNAVRYTPQGGRIEITADDKSLTIRNDIADTTDTDAICEPFVKGDQARGARTGSGMGLSIVKQIMTLNGLRFRVKSENRQFIAQIQIK